MKKSICFIANIELPIRAFLAEHFAAMLPLYTITVVTNTANRNFLKDMGLDIDVVPIPIQRRIAPVRDVLALSQLYSLFRARHFDAIHTITPKSGLVCMVAGSLAGVPIRIHTFTGQVWATQHGFKRGILKTADRVMARYATHILVDSQAQRDFLIKERLITRENSAVIANGSMCGVDTERFAPDLAIRHQIRRELGIPNTDFVYLFLGRLNRDKGLLDLGRAFRDMCSAYNDIRLIIVGDDEDGTKEKLSSILSPVSKKVHFIDYTLNPEHYMAASDVITLPSYREGFGAVIIEGGSTGIPSVGSRIYGLADAIEDGQTGFFFEPGNIEELRDKMTVFYTERNLWRTMGVEARSRAVRLFSRDIVVSGMLEFYAELFCNN